MTFTSQCKLQFCLLLSAMCLLSGCVTTQKAEEEKEINLAKIETQTNQPITRLEAIKKEDGVQQIALITPEQLPTPVLISSIETAAGNAGPDVMEH